MMESQENEWCRRHASLVEAVPHPKLLLDFDCPGSDIAALAKLALLQIKPRCGRILETAGTPHGPLGGSHLQSLPTIDG
jgi:hypothetical protein